MFCFSRSDHAVWGCVAQYSYRSGILNLDTSLFRNIGNLEKLHAQFRAEFFNVLNHTNFASPVVPTNNTSLFAANGAPISSTGVLTSRRSHHPRYSEH